MPELPGIRKRKLNPRNSLQLTRIQFVDGDAVKSVFVDNGVPQVIVPLWCQYTAAWRNVDVGSDRWLIVSNYECWAMGLVNAVTHRSVREVAKTFLDHFRKHFRAALATARKANNSENPLSDSDSDHNAATARDHCGSAVLEITLGEFTITCLNSTRKLTLKIDEVALKFIAGWIVPLVRACAKNKAPSQEKLESAPSTAPFHLRECLTPNIRGKVCWNPTEHKWKLILKHAKGNSSEDFAVAPDQDANAYEMQKVAAYWRAVESWNHLDASSRHRIPITRFA